MLDSKYGVLSMNNPDSNQAIITFSEFLTGAVATDSFEQVADEIAKEQLSGALIDPNARRDDEWSALANQVVGRENLRFSM